MKVSIVTVVLNAADTIADTLQSIAEQSHPDIEHIVIDGGSTDASLDILNQRAAQISHLISEPDNGLYDAMNKGMALASGDVVGILNADDVFADHSVVAQIAEAFADQSLDAVYADLVYVDVDDLSRVRRKYQSGEYQAGKGFSGWMPAHATLYLRRTVHEKNGQYNVSVGAQADLEYCARAFEITKINSRYIPKVWVRMRLGGISNNGVLNRIRANWRSYKALQALGMKRNPVLFFIRKFTTKMPGFFSSGSS